MVRGSVKPMVLAPGERQRSNLVIQGRAFDKETILPAKLNLAIAQAAAKPKTRLRGTAILAAIRVSLIAARASGSSKLAKYAPRPFSSAAEKTAARGRGRGRKRKKPRKNRVTARSVPACPPAESQAEASRPINYGFRDNQ
jgi:hypothetical protein